MKKAYFAIYTLDNYGMYDKFKGYLIHSKIFSESGIQHSTKDIICPFQEEEVVVTI